MSCSVEVNREKVGVDLRKYLGRKNKHGWEFQRASVRDSLGPATAAEADREISLEIDVFHKPAEEEDWQVCRMGYPAQA